MRVVDMSPAERLTVAADFKPADWGGRRGVRDKVVSLAQSLRGTGVTFKVNTILRAIGYGLLEEISEQGLVPWADLKLSDTKDTDQSDIDFLAEVQVPKLLVTVKCDSGAGTLRHLVAKLPRHIELIGITVLSDMTEDDCQVVFGREIHIAIDNFFAMAGECGLGGIVCSGKDAAKVNAGRTRVSDKFTINTPNIRPAWAEVKGDGQNVKRAATIAEALAYADRVVIGRPITQQEDVLGATRRCLEEVYTCCGGLPD